MLLVTECLGADHSADFACVADCTHLATSPQTCRETLRVMDVEVSGLLVRLTDLLLHLKADTGPSPDVVCATASPCGFCFVCHCDA